MSGYVLHPTLTEVIDAFNVYPNVVRCCCQALLSVAVSCLALALDY